MMKQALFAAANLAALAGPVASHAQMQAMDNAGLRDVAGQGISLTPVSYRVVVMGQMVYGAVYDGYTRDWALITHADQSFKH